MNLFELRARENLKTNIMFTFYISKDNESKNWIEMQKLGTTNDKKVKINWFIFILAITSFIQKKEW